MRLGQASRIPHVCLGHAMMSIWTDISYLFSCRILRAWSQKGDGQNQGNCLVLFWGGEVTFLPYYYDYL